MALMLADKNRALFRLEEVPEDIDNPTLAELQASTQCSDRVFLNDTYFRATSSESITDPFLNGNPNQAWGADNWEAQVAVARFFEEGKPSVTEDTLFEAIRAKGSTNVWATRKGVAWDAEIEAGQEFSIFVTTSDNPQEPQENTGYEKVISPQAVQQVALFVTATA